MLRPLLIALTLVATDARPSYSSKIPNADKVVGCEGQAWPGVGHLRSSGGGARNPFGVDFAAAGHTWTAALCAMDSDGDGVTNGAELGDPDCTWSQGLAPQFDTGITHPGISCTSTPCGGASDVAPTGTGCASYTAPSGVQSHDMLFQPFAVPSGTTYALQALTWPAATDSAVPTDEQQRA